MNMIFNWNEGRDREWAASVYQCVVDLRLLYIQRFIVLSGEFFGEQMKPWRHAVISTGELLYINRFIVLGVGSNEGENYCSTLIQ